VKDLFEANLIPKFVEFLDREALTVRK